MSTTFALENGMVVDFSPLATKVSDEEFAELCRLNPELQIERTSEGELVIAAPTGGKTGIRNAKLTMAFGLWAERDGTGQNFDSSTLFSLPNGARRSPDLSWIRNERWEALSPQQQEQFPPLCPDFVVELRSETDSLKSLTEKMQEYITNGGELGWLIDPSERKVHVYRPGLAAEILDDPETVSGESPLRGFVLDVRSLWD
ncbi:MAG TPA: Uma2 family endonuclease [Pyrinomonadaceae bacterium]|nr:Uma2 family endonuclease [Pyrinomonadaceae bacterium]